MIDKNSKTAKLLSAIGSIIFIAVFFIYPFGLVLLLFLAVFLYLGFKASTKKNFLKFQAVLPTSKIRSMAMGLVEVQGKIKCQKLIRSKIGNIQCVAYHYTVRREERDSEGRSSYKLIDEESKMADFSIADDTGSVDVYTQDLDCVWLPEKGSYSSGSLHYKQTILLPADEVLLIGQAANVNGKVVIKKDDINNVFNLTHASSVDKWNTFKPLLNSLYVFGAISCVIIIVILKADVSIDNGVVFYSFNNIF
ncbi:MAG: hypothetical protein HRU06_09065 [Oceanospirillaceae bacterium]|nr:hypothetical protein [Oceanospirillaceae bacterium]